MNDYFQGSVKQHLERGQRLLGRIPPDLPREFHLLAQACDRELSYILDQLQLLLDDPKMRLLDYQPERLRQFRRLVATMNFLEAFGIAALERFNENDEFLNRLIERIRIEISYPLLPPVVTSLSQRYFHIHPQLGLLLVPLSEGDFLLHLPDLYHELAHPLVTEKYNPRTKPFQKALSDAIDSGLGYIAEELQKEERRRSPQAISFYLRQWGKSWWKWVIELFCDLFATYTTGPAFVWAHFHLFAKLGENPFSVPTSGPSSHPADDARMKTMLYGLQVAHFSQEADSIRERWEEIISISGARPEPEYRRCFPQYILKDLAHKAFEGVSAVGCRIATYETKDPVYSILNQAWAEFWRDPAGYTNWERKAVEKLRELCLNSH